MAHRIGHHVSLVRYQIVSVSILPVLQKRLFHFKTFCVMTSRRHDVWRHNLTSEHILPCPTYVPSFIQISQKTSELVWQPKAITISFSPKGGKVIINHNQLKLKTSQMGYRLSTGLKTCVPFHPNVCNTLKHLIMRIHGMTPIITYNSKGNGFADPSISRLKTPKCLAYNVYTRCQWLG